jgi:hypothetical protein
VLAPPSLPIGFVAVVAYQRLGVGVDQPCGFLTAAEPTLDMARGL